MELRHLRCFLALAEELHFGRAAQKMHVDQSPFSRTIKELEEELGAQLFTRNTRNTRLTHAGKAFCERVPRIFVSLEQARDGVQSAAKGFRGQLRIAFSDGVPPSRLPALLARCREEEPEIDIRLFEVSLDQQIQGLHDDLYDIGFSMAEEVGEGIVAIPAWEDELMVAVPARHTALAHSRIPLEEVLRYPMVLGDPAVCAGHALQVERFLRRQDQAPIIVQRVATFGVMMILVAAGIAFGLAGSAHIASSRDLGVVARRLQGTPPMLVTYLLRRDAEPSEVLARFIARVATIDSDGSEKPANDS